MLEFRELFSKAKHIAVITGAGVSAESGVPTFRGVNEKWRKWLSQVLKTPGFYLGPVFGFALEKPTMKGGGDIGVIWVVIVPATRFDSTKNPNVSFLLAGPGDARGLLSKPIPGLGVLPVPEGRGAEQEAQRRPSGHRGVRSPAEEAGTLGGRHHAVHRRPSPPGRVQTRAQSSR